MIYIVQIPDRLEPSVWVAINEPDLVEKVYEIHAQSRSNLNVFEELTARSLLLDFGYTPENLPQDECQSIRGLAEKYGWDKTLYRADYLLGEGEYTDKEVKQFDAAVAYIDHDMYTSKVFLSTKDATDALNDDDEWKHHQGQKARSLLWRALATYA